MRRAAYARGIWRQLCARSPGKTAPQTERAGGGRGSRHEWALCRVTRRRGASPGAPRAIDRPKRRGGVWRVTSRSARPLAVACGARARFEPAARRRGNWSVCQVARPRYFRVPPPEARELFTAGRADELKRASRLARRDCPARSLNETRADTQRPASGGGHRVYNAPSNGDSRRLVTGAHGGKGKGGH